MLSEQTQLHSAKLPESGENQMCFLFLFCGWMFQNSKYYQTLKCLRNSIITIFEAHWDPHGPLSKLGCNLVPECPFCGWKPEPKQTCPSMVHPEGAASHPSPKPPPGSATGSMQHRGTQSSTTCSREGTFIAQSITRAMVRADCMYSEENSW